MVATVQKPVLAFKWCVASLSASTNSQHSRFARATSPRTQGSLGPDLKLPFIADCNMSISRVAASVGRGFFIVDPKGIPRCATHDQRPPLCN
ncbi:uncharacterized protein BXZ73DRAFT_102239 [Epithele typhae]|uniref:uncharacterized protein n=1 Tax=Epithele typhae TaxID=378194 RepID=UPI0020081A94|nr:uncharacterized protein BXZ73DRAFT_102239 [Epithele typhae]KAH9929085.1 hypothetical protein BXZ73DRAFT_102239 [Epithele typhae]